MLKNFSRRSGAVAALAADVHRPHQKKCILRMFAGVYMGFALLIEGERKKSSSQISQLVSCLYYNRHSGLYVHER